MLKPSSVDEIKPTRSMNPRSSVSAGLARVIDRERPAYQHLAEKVAADERLTQGSRSDVLQTSSRRMIDAGVQSDHAVDLLAATQGTTEPVEETVIPPEKVDKATITDSHWPLSIGSEEDVADTADGIEHARLEAVDASAPGELSHKNTEEKIEEDLKTVSVSRSTSSRTRDKLHKVCANYSLISL